ncbi:MAG: hypothetical protein ACRD4B_08335, partial [Acidobacteriota bacterium]
FDSAQPFEMNLERPYVGWVTEDGSGDLELHLVNADMTTYTLAGIYKASSYPSFDPINATSGNSGAVGLVNSNIFTTDITKVNETFDDAYTEFRHVQTGEQAIPYLPPTFFGGYKLRIPDGNCSNRLIEAIPGHDFSPYYRFAWMWFDNGGSVNHLWITGADTPQQLSNCLLCVKGKKGNIMPTYLGFAQKQHAIAYVFRGGIRNGACSGSQASEDAGVRNVNNHEIGHIFGREHDDRCQWTLEGPTACSSQASPCADVLNNGCQMAPGRQIYGPIFRLDRFDLVCDADSIRKQNDLQGVMP